MKKTAMVCSFLAVFFALVAFPSYALDKPVVTLERVEIASVQPFFTNPRIGYKSEKEPGEAKPGAGFSSTLALAYIFNIKNPNKQPLMLDEIQFSTTFDKFEVNTISMYERAWIPGEKTNQVRIMAINEAVPTIVNLSVGSASTELMKAMNAKPAELAAKWWKEIGDFGFEIGIINGTASFKDEAGKDIQATFSGKWPLKQ